MLTPLQEEQFFRLYDKYGAMLYRIALMHAGNPGCAEDILYDAFRQCLGKPPPIQAGDEKFRLIRAVFSCRGGPAYPQLGGGSIKDRVMSLPPRLRCVVCLHIAGGYSVSETAKLLNVSDSALNVLLMRARQKLYPDLETKKDEIISIIASIAPDAQMKTRLTAKLRAGGPEPREWKRRIIMAAAALTILALLISLRVLS
jgi:predicted DNA-binding protein YlxM (UPF0122 family)